MRTITYFDSEPQTVEIIFAGEGKTVYVRQNIEQDGEQWKAVELSAKVTRNATIDDDFITKLIAKETAKASAEVRKKRDELLAKSDEYMCLDRLGLTVPSGSTFTAWLSFLKGLGNILNGSIAKYRQALRDIPEQDGFPFDVKFPELKE